MQDNKCQTRSRTTSKYFSRIRHRRNAFFNRDRFPLDFRRDIATNMASLEYNKLGFGSNVIVEARGDCAGKGRSQPMQVLVLGMCRTGTLSMTQALNTLGYKTYHMYDEIAPCGSIYYFLWLTRDFSLMSRRNAILNPADVPHWHRAFDAKYSGKGKWTVKDWDDLLGDANVGCRGFLDFT